MTDSSSARRKWIKQTAALASGTVLANSVFANAAVETENEATRRIPLSVSTYSYWHFKTDKFPIEKVIENAAALGFDAVEILHRQMQDETPAYINKLKRL